MVMTSETDPVDKGSHLSMIEMAITIFFAPTAELALVQPDQCDEIAQYLPGEIRCAPSDYWAPVAEYKAHVVPPTPPLHTPAYVSNSGTPGVVPKVQRPDTLRAAKIQGLCDPAGRISSACPQDV